MDRHLKPSRFDADHSSSSAAKEWTHWLRTFRNFIKAIEKAIPGEETIDKLEILTNFVSPNIYAYIADSASYEEAIKTLTSLFVKPSSEIFARHQLATHKQQPGEALDDYMQSLRALSKDCQFKDVTALVYTEESIRDAFISGISSQLIRTRLLENATLTLDAAFTQARSLELAQRHSETYKVFPSTIATTTVPKSEELNPPVKLGSDSLVASGVRNPQRNSYNQTNIKQNTCQYCGKEKHYRNVCPARNSKCDKCYKQGHWASVCKSSTVNAMAADMTPLLYFISSFHPKVLVTVSINHKSAQALVDTGANLTCVSEKKFQRNRFDLIATNQPKR